MCNSKEVLTGKNNPISSAFSSALNYLLERNLAANDQLPLFTTGERLQNIAEDVLIVKKTVD